MAPLVLGGAALWLTRGRSFQSATGMLYLCVAFIFIGEILGRGLLLLADFLAVCSNDGKERDDHEYADETAINPKIFRAYDVRGIYPDEFERRCRLPLSARAFVQYLASTTVAVGRDMRVSSPGMAAAVIRGITDQGADAIDLGLTTTDELYFAVGKFGYPARRHDHGLAQSRQYNG